MKTILLIFILMSALVYAHEDENLEIAHSIEVDSFVAHLTQVEQEYLKEQKKLPLCLHPNIFPIDGYEDAKHTGIMGDVYQEISKKIGVEFIPVVSRNYSELYKNIEDKKCKLVSILPTKNQKSYNLKMTKPFFSTYFTLVSRIDKPFIRNPINLKGKKLLVRFKAHRDKILKHYPYLEIHILDDNDILMKRVLNDEVFAVIVVNESSDYLIDAYGHGKLKINGFISKENLVSGSVGVLKDETVLFEIIQKTLSSIAPEKIDEIINDWRLTRYHTKTDYSLVWKILLFSSFLVAIMGYYHRELKRANKNLAKTVDELRKKDEILTVQSKQAAMGEMISMIAHQWRQPLSNITLQISNLQINKMLDSQSIDDDEIDNTLSEISDSIIYLSHTIDDFQTYFHPNRKMAKVELHGLLKKVVSFVQPRINGQDIEILIVESNNIYIEIHVNELIQVILNILNNAIDALVELKRDNKQIKVYAESIDSKLIIYVQDNADGIEPDNKQKLFEPYFSTKGKNGTGLGLYMSQMIIQKQFGGDISVESSQDGSIFAVEIPNRNKKQL